MVNLGDEIDFTIKADVEGFREVKQAEEDIENVAEEAQEASGALSEVTAASGAAAGGMKASEEAAEDLDDELDDLDGEMDGIAIAASKLDDEFAKATSFDKGELFPPGDYEDSLDEIESTIKRKDINITDDLIKFDVDAISDEADDKLSKRLNTLVNRGLLPEDKKIRMPKTAFSEEFGAEGKQVARITRTSEAIRKSFSELKDAVDLDEFEGKPKNQLQAAFNFADDFDIPVSQIEDGKLEVSDLTRSLRELDEEGQNFAGSMAEALDESGKQYIDFGEDVEEVTEEVAESQENIQTRGFADPDDTAIDPAKDVRNVIDNKRIEKENKDATETVEQRWETSFDSIRENAKEATEEIEKETNSIEIDEGTQNRLGFGRDEAPGINNIRQSMREMRSEAVETIDSVDELEDRFRSAFDDTAILKGANLREVAKSFDDISDANLDIDASEQALQNIQNETIETIDSVDRLEKKFRGAFTDFDFLEDANIGGVAESFAEISDEDIDVDSAKQALENIKNETSNASEKNEYLSETASKTKEEMEQEVEEFINAAKEADNLSQKKEVASNANKHLKEAAGLTNEELRNEAEAMVKTASDAENLDEVKRKVANRTHELKEASQKSEKEIIGEASSFREAAKAAESLEGMKQAVSGANRTLALDSHRGEAAILDEKNAILQAEASASSTENALRQLAAEETKVSLMAEAAADEFDHLSREEQQTALSALMASASLEVTEESLDNVEDEADDAADELGETARSLTAGALAAELFSGEMGSLSLNLGAVNIALRSMTQQVPMLITVLGTLLSVVGGLASAALAAGTGLAGIFGAGVLAQAQQFEKNISEVKSTGEGLQAVMANIKEQFISAAEPLLSQSETVDLFVNTVNDLAQEVNLLARTIRNMMGFFTDFAAEVGAILDTGFNNFVESMAVALVELEEPLINIIEYFAIGLPNAILFFTEITERVGGELGNLIKSFIAFSKDVIRFGAAIQSGAIPVLNAVLNAFESLFEAINKLGQQNIAGLAGFAAAIVVSNKLVGIIVKLSRVFLGLSGSAFDVYKSVTSANGAIAKMRALSAGLTKGLGTAFKELSGFQAVLEFVQVDLVQAATAAEFTEEQLEELGDQSIITSAKITLLGMSTDATNDELIQLANNVSFATAAASAHSAAQNKLYSAVSNVYFSLGMMSRQIVAAGKQMKTLAATEGLLSALTYGVSAAFGAATFTLGGFLSVLSSILLPLLAIGAAGALVVGVLGNMGSVTEGLKSLLDSLVQTLIAIGKFLIGVFVPIWNDLLTVMELIITVVNLVMGLFGGSGNVMGGLADTVIGFFETIAWVMTGMYDFIAGIASGIMDIMEAMGIETADLSGAKVEEGEVVANAEKLGKSAADMVPGGDKKVAEFNQNNVSNNYGDVNADPEEKDAMKRLIKEAMMEANTYRRRDDGYSG